MKEKILDSAERMVQSRGLNSVSFKDLADDVGLSKATVFHHFRNREELVLALVDRCETKHGKECAAVVNSPKSAPKKLVEFAEGFGAELEEELPCLLGSIGSCLSTLSPKTVTRLHEVTTAMTKRFETVFEQGRREGTLSFEGKPKDAAICFFAMM